MVGFFSLGKNTWASQFTFGFNIFYIFTYVLIKTLVNISETTIIQNLIRFLKNSGGKKNFWRKMGSYSLKKL